MRRASQRFHLKVVSSANIPPCEECRACCTVMGVEELAKENFEPCKHECESGCAIYGQHPPSCKDFLCSWKTGQVSRQHANRPDRLGVIVNYDPAHDCFQVWEVWPGAGKTKRVKAVIAKLKRRYGKLTVTIDKRLGQWAWRQARQGNTDDTDVGELMDPSQFKAIRDEFQRRQ